MALIDELKRRMTEIEAELQNLEQEAADARDDWERKMAEIRQRRQKMEDTLSIIKTLIKKEAE
jgi:predicted  nucleic acid-binding Zn-ribbon protein